MQTGGLVYLLAQPLRILPAEFIAPLQHDVEHHDDLVDVREIFSVLQTERTSVA